MFFFWVVLPGRGQKSGGWFWRSEYHKHSWLCASCKGNIFSVGTASLQKEKAPAEPGHSSLQNESYHSSNRLVKAKISSPLLPHSEATPRRFHLIFSRLVTSSCFKIRRGCETRPLPLRCVLRIVEITGNSMNLDRLNRITVEAGKCGGRPCIRGLRIRVTDVLELLAAGASYEEILADYPYLEREDILAALDYAAHQTDHVVLPAS